MKNKKKLIIIIIVFEIFFIIYLLKSLQNHVKFLTVIETLNKSQLAFTNENNIKYFYEPNPNTKKVYSSDFLKRSIIATVNNDSLFETCNYSIEKPNDVYRIISLGDSFTEGFWVNISDNYSEKLEDLLNNHSKNCKVYKKFEIINLGVSGYDIQYSVIRFEKRGLKYKPDLVIWFLKYDDFAIISEIWMKIQQETSFPNPETHYKEFMEAWNNKVKQYINQNLSTNKEFINQKYIIEPLMNFFDITKKENIKVIIFTHVSSIGDDYDEMLEKMIANYSHVNYIKLNIDQNFYNQNLMIFYNKENPLISDTHPNEQGHKIIALNLFNNIKSSLLKNC